MTSDPSPVPHVRTTWQLLTDRRFGSFIVGKTLAFVGVWIHNVVAAVVAWQITHSAMWVAMVSIVQFVPQILLAPIIGPLADRSSRGRLVAYGRIFCVSGTGGLALWLWIRGVDGVGIEAVLITTFVTGVGFAVSGPAMQAMVPDLVEPAEVGRAVSLDSVPTMLGRAAGPAVGALLAAFIGPAAALGVGTAGHLAFGLTALVLARTERPVEQAADEGGRFRDGLAYIWNNRIVVVLLLAVAAVGMGADPVVTLAPPLAHDLGADEALVGYLGSAFGVGALVGSVVSTLLAGGVGRQAAAPMVGLVVLGLGLIAAPMVPHAVAACGCFVLAGIGFTVALSGCTAMLHHVVPPSMRGRVMSLWLIAFMGTRPVAALIDGLLADLVGTRAAFVVIGVGIVATGVCCLPGKLSAGVTTRGAR